MEEFKNPMPAAKGNPEVAILEECANCDAVTLGVCNAWSVIFANANHCYALDIDPALVCQKR